MLANIFILLLPCLFFIGWTFAVCCFGVEAKMLERFEDESNYSENDRE